MVPQNDFFCSCIILVCIWASRQNFVNIHFVQWSDSKSFCSQCMSVDSRGRQIIGSESHAIFFLVNFRHARALSQANETMYAHSYLSGIAIFGLIFSFRTQAISVHVLFWNSFAVFDHGVGVFSFHIFLTHRDIWEL